MQKESLEEKLLDAWLDVSAVIRNDRFVNGLTFNETFICNLLLRQKRKDPSVYLTAADLCEMTGILKSQMNRCLTSLEKKGMIERIRSEEDKRKIFLKFREEHAEIYEKEHEHTLRIPKMLIEEIGRENVQQIIMMLNRVTEITSGIIKEENA